LEKANLLESEWDENPSKEGIEMLKNGRRMVEEQKRALDGMVVVYNEYFREE